MPTSACRKALDLSDGTVIDPISALSMVEAAISALENDPCLNAGPEFFLPYGPRCLTIIHKGCGSNLTLDGTVECDAAIMDDHTNFGSVGAVQGGRRQYELALY